MLKHKFTLRESILLLVATILALGIFYYEVIYKNYQDALSKYDVTNIQQESEILTAKAVKKKTMETYIEEHKSTSFGEVATYNNITNEIEALAEIFEDKNISISWQEPYLIDSIVRRNVEISTKVGSYKEAEEIVNEIANLKYRCIISSLSINTRNNKSVEEENEITLSMSVTFYETVEGATDLSGLDVEESAEKVRIYEK